MILGIGSINVDRIINCKTLPHPAESIMDNSVTIMLGGKEANQIVAASRLGAETILIGMLGENDPCNAIVLNDLNWANVCTDYIGYASGVPSGSAVVCVDESGQNLIIIDAAANALVTPEVIEKNRHCFDLADVCMTEFAIPMESCECAMKLAKEKGKLTIVNPAPYAEISASLYKSIDIITPNEVEAAGFCGFPITDSKSAAEGCAFFHGKGVKNAVITMGSQGVFVSDGKKQALIPSQRVRAIDTSGAGDCFNGGMAYACSKGFDVFTAAKFANAAASISVQKKGTARSMPTLSEVSQIYQL